ncbi:MAG: acyl-CoA thioester hydrolase [Hyphomicrobiaceae bacterium]|jgi:acyl-CoA thioester hydrolase
MARSDYKFFHRFRIRYSEIDGQGILYNAHYLTFFDQGITEYLRALPYDYKAETARTGHDFHTVKTLVEYAKPVEFDEEVDVCVKVGRIGRSSIRFDFEMHGRDAEDFRTSGEVVWVYTNQTTHKTAPVIEDLVARLVGLEGEGIRS